MNKLMAFLLMIALLAGAVACASPGASPIVSLSPSTQPNPPSSAASTSTSSALPPETPALASVGKDQQDIIDKITADLKQQGVPITSVQIVSDNRWTIPIMVEFVLKRSSESNAEISNGAMYASLISRAVNLAQKQGLIVGAVGMTSTDSQGKILSKDITRIKNKEDIPAEFDPPLKMDDQSVAPSLKQNISLDGLTINQVEVSEDQFGHRRTAFRMQTPDADTANKILGNIIGTVRTKILELNKNPGTQIAFTG